MHEMICYSCSCVKLIKPYFEKKFTISVHSLELCALVLDKFKVNVDMRGSIKIT
jgi:hypothetical protein